MPLVKDTSYQGVFFEYVLDGIRDILISEFTYGKVYIAPTIEHLDPFSIRLWGSSSSTDAMWQDAWMKEYFVDITMYFIQKNPTENFYKQFYNDQERVYQSLFNNRTKSITVSSNELTWIDGKVEEVLINDVTADEAEVEGLHTVNMTFSCKIERAS
tara:strand:+ start:2636 stop:3106 length:471 start_codon:yes stop_codon:yes gene_type:complete